MFDSEEEFIKKNVLVCPHPYKSLLGFSIDCDYLNWETFLELERYLCTKDITAFGRGLNREFSFGYFGFSDNPDQMSLFKGLEWSSQPTSYHKEMLSYIESDKLEFNHAFGDFDRRAIFTRNHAKRMLDTISTIHKNSNIFVDHGNKNNRQCIGDYEYSRGDVRGSTEYHTDLWVNGSDFFTDSVGSIEYVQFIDVLRTKNIPINVKRYRDDLNKNRNVLVSRTLRDGREIQKFHRFRGTGSFAPNWSNLSLQLERVKKKITKEKCDLIIYQHFGVLSKDSQGLTPLTLDNFDSKIVDSLKFFLEWLDDEKVLLTSQRKVLNYNLWKKHLAIMIDRNVIQIKETIESASFRPRIVTICNLPTLNFNVFLNGVRCNSRIVEQQHETISLEVDLRDWNKQNGI